MPHENGAFLTVRSFSLSRKTGSDVRMNLLFSDWEAVPRNMIWMERGCANSSPSPIMTIPHNEANGRVEPVVHD